jgi:hypothetical protein
VYTIAARSTRPACAGQAAAALRIAWGPGSERRGGPQLHPRPRVRPEHPHQMCFRTPGKSRRRRTVGRLKLASRIFSSAWRQSTTRRENGSGAARRPQRLIGYRPGSLWLLGPACS